MNTLAPVRFSNLKLLGQSPAHYKHRIDTQESGKRRAMTVGTVAHSMVLGGFDAVVYPGKVRNGKVWEAFKAERIKADPNVLILLQSEHDAAAGCARSIQRHKNAMYLLEGVHEAELAAWDWAGRPCGGRPDCVAPKWITELKTSATSEPWRFTRMGLRMHYHGQLAWYLDGNEARGGTAREAYIVAVETVPPYVVTCFEVTPKALDAGRRQNVLWMEELRRCEASDHWPGYTQAGAVFDIPDDEEDVALTFGDEAGNDSSGLEEVA